MNIKHLKITALASSLFLFSCTKFENYQKKEDSTSTKIDSTVSKTVLEFISGATKMTIDPNNGCRITSFTYNGEEVLIQKNEFEMYGSTFWTAPQSAWGWPPITSIDSEPYVKLSTNSFESKNADTLGVNIIKSFTVNPDSSIKVTYSIVNNSDKSIKIAPWEISRVVSGGTTIFPYEKATFKGKKPFGEVKITTKNGIATFKYDSSAINDNKKSFAYASEGWLAQHSGNLLLVKKFENINASNCAPDESEIEIYANPNKIYIEIEQQGAYRELKSKESYNWSVDWYLTKIGTKSYTETEYKAIIEKLIK